MWQFLNVGNKLIPSHVGTDEKGDYLVMFLGGLAALGLHALFLVLFFAFGVTPLTLFNVLSVILFTLVLVYLYRTGDTLSAVIVTAAEVIVHQAVAVYYLGWDCGFQYYLLCVSDFVFLARFRSKWAPTLLSGVSVSIMVALYFLKAPAWPPPFPEQVAQGLYVFNLLSAAGLLVLFSLVYNRMVSQQEEALRKLSSLDGLTGLTNRRRFDELLQINWSRCSRSGGPLSLIILDVDFFKLYNDAYGHQQGDECLRRVARVLASSLKRVDDVAARYGGEEFVCLLPHTPRDGAREIAERIVTSVRALQLPHAGSKAHEHVTISAGVATVQDFQNDDTAALLESADRALYSAKEKGRNQYTEALDLESRLPFRTSPEI